MKKNVVFIGTRSWYPYMVPAILSLIDHTPVDMIYLVIEDDDFPYELPCNYTVINVSGQKFFLPGSVNYDNYFTYICLLRVAFAEILPDDVEQVLSLDDDLIITDDISPMWDVDLKGKWLAAVPETLTWGVDTECYYNCGVVMYNLKQMRKDKIADKLIDYLNTVEVNFSDQVAINYFLSTNQDKAVKYPVRFNEFCNSGQTDNPTIVHYCGYTDWMHNNKMPRYEYLREYQEKFYTSDIKVKWETIMAKKNKGFRYMIHACPKRMWYVNDFLVPAMKDQGIKEKDIYIWNDDKGMGNLKSFVASMKYVKDNCPADDSIWHIQDDVLLASYFKAVTEKISIVAYGFCNSAWNRDHMYHTGEVPLNHSWTSFQAVCIPNRVAAQFYDWFQKETAPGHFRLMPWTKSGKCDDTIFKIFLDEKHPVETVFNVRPNVVEHIDYIIGGSTLSDRDKDGIRCATYWDEWDRTKEFKKQIEEYKKDVSK